MQTNNDRQVNEKSKLRPKRVRCIETGKEYPSLFEAAAAIEVHVAVLHECCGILGKTCEGLTWVYLDDDGAQELQRPARGRVGRRVMRLSDGKRFPTVRYAAQTCGVNEWDMGKAIKSGKPISGSLWAFDDDPETI